MWVYVRHLFLAQNFPDEVSSQILCFCFYRRNLYQSSLYNIYKHEHFSFFFCEKLNN